MWQDVQPCPAMYSSSLLLNTNECHNVSFQLIISNGRFALAVRGGRGESGLSLMFPHVGHAGVARGGGVLEFLLCPQSRLHWMNDVERSQYHIHCPSAAGTVTSHCQTSFVEHFCKFYSVINWGTFTSIRLKKKI